MYASAVGLVVKYLVANEMPRVRFPDGAFTYAALLARWQMPRAQAATSCWQVHDNGMVSLLVRLLVRYRIQELWWIKAGDAETGTLILDALWSVMVSGSLVWPAAVETSG